VCTRIADRQSKGHCGARHFDKLLADAIPEFHVSKALQVELA
jgi:hypothetical protein